MLQSDYSHNNYKLTLVPCLCKIYSYKTISLTSLWHKTNTHTSPLQLQRTTTSSLQHRTHAKVKKDEKLIPDETKQNYHLVWGFCLVFVNCMSPFRTAATNFSASSIVMSPLNVANLPRLGLYAIRSWSDVLNSDLSNELKNEDCFAASKRE